MQVVPDYVSEARHLPGADNLGYLATQTTAWWYYVANYIAPTGLVADVVDYPKYTSFAEPTVLLAIAGWAVVAVICRAVYGRYPQVLFVVLSGLALISPTSSVMPLAEMVNEHRPYLPIAIASLAFIVPLGYCLGSVARRSLSSTIAVATSLMVLYAAMGTLTWERNAVFQSAESYWLDVVEKAPSSRSHLNYGLEMMRTGRMAEARDHYEQALLSGPYWHITHINLGILNDAEGRRDEALDHFDMAVEYDEYSGASRLYRGQFLARQGEYALARQDLELSLERAVVRFPVLRSLALTSAGLADDASAVLYTEACFRLDPGTTENAIVEISTPFWRSPEAHLAGIEYFEALDSGILPERWWIHENIARLARRLGQTERADVAAHRAAELRDPD
jgi:tetratricopeptide (TPR) repeat protein